MKRINNFLFYFLSFTRGILISCIGLVVSITLILLGNQPKFFQGKMYFEIGYNWGGINLGFVFIVNRYALEETKKHECGHGIQNIVFGALTPFIISIPSAVRYWLYEFAEKGELFKYQFVLLLILLTNIILCVVCICYWQFILFGVLAVFAFYWSMICIWVVLVEGKKFINKPYPYYESIWFEKQATELGEKYF